MIRMHNKLFIPLIFFCITNIFCQKTFAFGNKILVKIENEIVTQYQLENKIKTLLFFSNKNLNQENINNTKNQALVSLINLNLKKHEVKKYDVEAPKESIDKQLLQISSGNIDDLKKKFLENNLDYDFLLEEVKIEMAWQKLIFSIYNKKVNINEKEIESQIENIKKKKTNIIEYKLAEIVISVSNEKDRIKKIDLITEEIKKNGFENTASKLSEALTSKSSGDLGWLNANSLSYKMSNILSKMTVGEISKPIVSTDNILFLKLVDKRSLKLNMSNKNNLRDNLIAQKKNELFSLYSRSHLSKIRNNALIEYK